MDLGRVADLVLVTHPRKTGPANVSNFGFVMDGHHNRNRASEL
jgi:hypothetical protein